ncbi:MAG: alpha/beta hydrolase [Deltaproteobacteria bacterium]|nr:alpha/beta hydrolase [Deltaproteobacteria bacterium]
MTWRPEWDKDIVHKTVVTPDDVPLRYMTLGDDKKKSVVAFANGLGGRLYSFQPIVEAIMKDHRIITWDYRGLFESGSPKKIRHLSIPNHARDLKAVMDAEGIDKVKLVGWSMGVQVALEFAVLYPENLESMVLINGTYGRALMTGFQPLGTVPGVDHLLHFAIDTAREHPRAARLVTSVAGSKSIIRPLGALYGAVRRNPRIKDILEVYMEDVLGESFFNYLRLFQELDAHYSFHHLKNIPHRTLIIYGGLDFLTPAYLSKRMKKKLKNVETLHLPFGTHFVLLEYPKKVGRAVARFFSK